MNQEENNEQLKQRIVELEDKVNSLSKLLPLAKEIEKIQESINRFESNLNLLSDLDIYSPLRDLLVAGDYKGADQETARVLLEISGEDRESLTPDDIKKFSCSSIRIIDRLWRNYSNDHFGFSIQLQLYQEAGGTRQSLIAQDMNSLIKFGDLIGWRSKGQWQTDNYPEWDFSLSAPKGCFPARWWSSPYGAKMVNFFFIRILECKLT